MIRWEGRRKGITKGGTKDTVRFEVYFLGACRGREATSGTFNSLFFRRAGAEAARLIHTFSHALIFVKGEGERK